MWPMWFCVLTGSNNHLTAFVIWWLIVVSWVTFSWSSIAVCILRFFIWFCRLKPHKCGATWQLLLLIPLNWKIIVNFAPCFISTNAAAVLPICGREYIQYVNTISPWNAAMGCFQAHPHSWTGMTSPLEVFFCCWSTLPPYMIKNPSSLISSLYLTVYSQHVLICICFFTLTFIFPVCI